MLEKLLKKIKEDEKLKSLNKDSLEYVIQAMKPEMEDEEDDEEEDDSEEEMKGKHKKAMGPEAKIEIELMLSNAKKKKSK